MLMEIVPITKITFGNLLFSDGQMWSIKWEGRTVQLVSAVSLACNGPHHRFACIRRGEHIQEEPGDLARYRWSGVRISVRYISC